MKINKLLIIPIALLLVSCGQTPSETSTEASLKPETSEESSVTSSSERPSESSEYSSTVTSEELTDETTEVFSQTSSELPSESSSSSSEEEKTWSDSEISLMKEYLNGYVPPYIPIEGGYWKVNGFNDHLAYAKDNGSLDDIDYLNAELVKHGFIDASDEDHGCFNVYQRFVYLPLQNTAKNEHIGVFITRFLKSQEFNAEFTYHIDNNLWDQKLVDEAVKTVHGIDVSVPKPEFDFLDFDIDVKVEFGQCIIMLYGDNNVESYIQTLKNNGYETYIDEFKQNIGIDPSKTLKLSVSYEWDEYVAISCLKNN